MNSPALLARPPMRYNSQPGPSSSGRLENDSGSDSSSSGDSSDSDSESEEEVHIQTTPIQKASVTMPKIKFPRRTKLFFVKAVENAEFLYGIHGKLQTLYWNFMKEFTFKFWKNCLGFDIDLDPPHQDITSAAYAKPDPSRKDTISCRMDGVPTFEESLPMSFFCQNRPYMNRVMDSRECDFLNGKFIRKQVRPLFQLMTMDTLPGEGFTRLRSITNMRFRVTVHIKLDYEDLNKSVSPHTVLSFEDVGCNGGAGWVRLRFLGRLFSRLAPRYILHSYKRWLGSCADFNGTELERELEREKNEHGRMRNQLLKMGGGGRGLGKKRSARKEKKRLARLEKKNRQRHIEASSSSSFRGGGGRSYQQQGGGSGLGGRSASTNSDHHVSGQSQSSSSLSSGRYWQAPSSWNRSMDLVQRNPPLTRRF
jgi:hypothetical protein